MGFAVFCPTAASPPRTPTRKRTLKNHFLLKGESGLIRIAKRKSAKFAAGCAREWLRSCSESRVISVYRSNKCKLGTTCTPLRQNSNPWLGTRDQTHVMNHNMWKLMLAESLRLISANAILYHTFCWLFDQTARTYNKLWTPNQSLHTRTQNTIAIPHSLVRRTFCNSGIRVKIKHIMQLASKHVKVTNMFFSNSVWSNVMLMPGGLQDMFCKIMDTCVRNGSNMCKTH